MDHSRPFTLRFSALRCARALAPLLLLLAVCWATPVGAVTVEKRVATSGDDAEEDAGGTVTTGSSDLELIHDVTDQKVGMRWTALTIPQGATITAAWIQFSARESQSEATNLILQGQAADNPPRFQSSANVSGRPRTIAAAAWAPAPWNAGETGANQKTPDLSAVVQEIVNRPGWASGNAMVMIVTGSGHRTAYAFDGNSALAPLLHVEYIVGPPPDNPPTALLTVTQLLTPPLTVMADGSASTDPDVTPIATYRFDFGDGSPVVVTNAPSATASHTYAAAGSYTVSLVATDTGGQPSAPATTLFNVLAPGAITTLEKRTSASSDDAEEAASGSVSLNSSDLELVEDASTQTVGMRWTGVTIPQGAQITAAWVQFSAKESQSQATSLTLCGQAADAAAAFTTGSLNVSSRPRTTSVVGWVPAAWNAGETTDTQKTPDLVPLVQEIVLRPGWQSGNPLALIVTGSGHRTAWAFDGSAAAAPLLHVEWSNNPPPENPPVARLSVTLLASPPLGVSADGSASTDFDATPIASFRFDFGDGTPPVVATAPSATAEHAYAAPGIYTVSLVVTDTGGFPSAPETEIIGVGLSNLAPNGTINQPATNLTITAGQSVNLQGTGIDPDNNAPIAYLWDLGGAAPNLALEDPGSIMFSVPGTYLIRFKVADALGLPDPTPDTRTITVNPPSSALADEVHWSIIGPTAVTFDWRGGSTTLRYGLTPAYGQTATGVAPSPIPFSSLGPFREAKLTGLSPNTTYHYSIGTGPDHTFHTPPLPGASGFTVVAQGDIGASSDWPNVAAIQSRIATLAPDVVLMLGDLTYGNTEGPTAVDGHFNDVMTWSQDAPYQVAWGNHEWEGPATDDMRNYKGRFDLPNPQSSPRAPASGCCGEDWGWFDYGNVRFIGYPEYYDSNPSATRTPPPIPGTSCGCLPADNVWNTDISTLPVHVKSAAWVNSIGLTENLDVGFGPPSYGMPWVVTDPSTPKTSVFFTDHSGQSDPGPYPFQPTTPLEQGTGDKHAFMIDKSSCKLYELFKANWNGGAPRAGDGAIFDLGSNALRPDGWTSADDAGLPIYPGLARMDEVLAGEIRHALRFTASMTNPVVGSHLWPARFEASYTGLPPDPNLPPMGARFRLKASFDISGYSVRAQVILRALQRYGLMLADVGTDWTLSGTYDPLWTNSLMDELRTVPGSQFEAIDQSSLMINPNSGQARQPIPAATPWADWASKAATVMDQAQADPSIRFIVTYGHRPAYSSGFHEGETELQSAMGTLAGAHSKYVLNLNGHSHDYERSIALNGVVHVTAGTGGSELEPALPPCVWTGGCPPPPWSAYRAMHHAVLKLRFTDTSIQGTVYCGPAEPASNDIACAEGTVLDTFQIPELPPDQPPVVTAPATASAAENAPLTINIAASDPDGNPITSLSVAGLPAGATFTPGAGNTSGTLSWTPGFSHAGSYTVTFTASNALSGSASTAITITNVDRAPVVAAPPGATVAQNQPLVVDVTATDVDGEAITTLGAAGLPAGASFTTGVGNATGTLQWTPSYAQSGAYVVTFTASNALSGSASTTITVTGVDVPPAVTAPATASAAENGVLTVDVTASDLNGDPIASLGASGLPAGATFTPGAGNTSGTLSWTPGYDQAGSYVVTFTASNALSGSTSTAITVTNVDRAPLLTAPANVSVAQNQPLTVDVTATDEDGEAITTLAAAGLPVGASFTTGVGNATGTLHWTPSYAQSGAYVVTFTASNALSVSASTTITVTGVDLPPLVTAPATATAAENGQLTIDVTASDLNGDAIASLTASGLPGGASFTPGAANTSGTLSWTPSFTQAGSYVVTFTASNSLSGSATTSITITNVDRPPVVTAPATSSGTENSLLTIDVIAADSDGEPIVSLDVAGLPAGATFTPAAGNTSGTLSWTPSYAQAGSYVVTFTASNALVGSAQTQIDVGHVNGRPTAALTASPATGNTPLEVILSAAGATDPEGPIASYAFDFGDGAVTGPQPLASVSHGYGAGQWTAKVVVADAEGLEDSTTAEILVAQLPIPNLALNGSFENDANGWSAIGGGTLQTIPGGFDGGRSGLVTGSSGAAPFGIVDDPGWILSVPPGGAHYDYEAWVRSPAATGLIQISISEYVEGVEVNAPVSTAPALLSPAWQRMHLGFTACCAGSQVRMQIVHLPAQAGGAFEIDNVSIAADLGTVGIGAPVVSGEAKAWLAPVPLREDGVLHYLSPVAGPVSVTIFDPRGRVVRRLLDRQWIPAGRHQLSLDGRDDRGDRLPSGVYLYKVTLPGRVLTGRMLVVR